MAANPQCAVVLAPGADLTIRANPFKVLEASLSGELVRAALEQRFRKVPAPEDWAGALQQSAATASFRGAVEWMATEIERRESPLAKPGKPRLHAERMLLSLFIECLAQIAPAEIDGACSISEMQARMAEEWIEAHLTEPIGVEEVANAVGVGVRSLQLSFQRARGYSPSQAMLMLRLERAHKLLLTGAPDASVTSIAADLCFFELSRFAKRYRERFGESPSHTLARSRA